MSSIRKPRSRRRTLAAIARRGSDIISLNRALVGAVQAGEEPDGLAPGDLAKALREGRVTIVIAPRGETARPPAA